MLSVDDMSVMVRNIDGSIVAVWKLAEIEKRFEAKVRNVLLVKAKVEERDGIEYFLFDRARLLSNGTDQSILKNQFENENLLVDLRLHDAGTMARNHGTGFRVFENKIDELVTHFMTDIIGYTNGPKRIIVDGGNHKRIYIDSTLFDFEIMRIDGPATEFCEKFRQECRRFGIRFKYYPDEKIGIYKS